MGRLAGAILAAAVVLALGCSSGTEPPPARRRPSGPPPWAPVRVRRAKGRIVEVRILAAGIGERWPDLHPSQNGEVEVRILRGAPDFPGLGEGRRILLWEPDAQTRFRPGDYYDVDLWRDGTGEWRASGWTPLPPPEEREERR